MIDVWTGRVTVSIFTDGEQSNARIVPAGESFVYNPVPMINAAFGLGLDYLFMPAYALALAFGTLLATQQHGGLVRTLGAVAGYGAFAAMLSDALENFALLQVLLGAYTSGYPAMAAFCASIKFGFLLFGILVGLFAWLWPKEPRS